MGVNNEITFPKFTIVDAFDAATEWVMGYTRIGWLFVIGIILSVAKLTGFIIDADTPWINVLWPFIVVVSVLVVATMIFYRIYDYKMIVETEVSPGEYKESLMWGKRWGKIGIKKVILKLELKQQTDWSEPLRLDTLG